MIRRPSAPNRRPLGRLGVLVFLALATAVARPSAALAQAGPGDAGFAAHLHAGDTTFVVVEDPLPHLKTLLTSQALRRAFAKGPLAEMTKAFGDPVDPVIGWDWVLKNRRWIPQQVAVGASDAGVGDLDHLFRAAALFELMQAAAGGDRAVHPQLADEVKALRKSLLDEAQAFQLPRVRAYVRFRDAADAVALLDLLRLQLNDVDPKALPDGLRIEPQDRRLTVRFALADFLGNDEQARAFIASLDLADPDDAALTGQMLAALRQVRAEVSLRVVGDALLLTVGPDDTGGPAGLRPRSAVLPAAVGPADATTLLWGRWNARRLKQAAKGWLALHERWASTAAYAAVRDRPGDDASEPMLDTVRMVAVQVAAVADAGAGRLWADPASGSIRAALQEDRVAVAPDLAKHPAARFLPADAEAYTVETTRGLGEYASDALLQLEDRLATQSLKSQLNPADAKAAGAAELEGGYYAHFGAFRDLVHKAGRDRFESGVLMVLGTRGRVDRFEASYEVDGRPTRLSLRNLPAVELALVGKFKAPADEAAVRKYAEDVYAAFATGCRSTARNHQLADKPLPPVQATAKPVDLGLGVPTWGFDAGWLAAATGEAKLRLDVVGDLRPHFFVADGCVAFSTSARLSKAMLAARDNKPIADKPAAGDKAVAGGRPAGPPRLALPEPGTGGTLVAVGHYPGDALAKTFEHLGGWVAAVQDALDPANGGDAGGPAAARRHRFTQEVGTLGQIARLVDRVEWQTVQVAGQPTHVTRGGVFFSVEKN
jgi:hypothetical protein